MIFDIWAIVFLFSSRVSLSESRSLSSEGINEWNLSCKEGFFASDIQTWYIQASSGERMPSALRITCSNPSDPMDIQQIQAFDTKSGPWQESRSCPFGEQMVGLNLWPSMDKGSSFGAHHWNPQILCLKQRQKSRLGSGRSLSTKYATCNAGHAMCGIHGKLVEMESKFIPSFKNYGIKCCKLPKERTPKKIVTIKPVISLPHQKKFPESKIFKISIGPPTSNVRTFQRKPKHKPSFKTPPIESKDFALKLLINPKKSKEEQPRELFDETKLKKIPLLSGKNPVLDTVIPCEQRKDIPKPFVIKKFDKVDHFKFREDKDESRSDKSPSYSTSSVDGDEVPQKGPISDFRKTEILESVKIDSNNEEDQELSLLEDRFNPISEQLNINGYPMIDTNIVNLEGRSINNNKLAQEAKVGTKSNIFEDGVVFVDRLDSKVPLTAIQKSNGDQSLKLHQENVAKPMQFQTSKDRLLDIEVISSDSPLEVSDEAKEDFEDYSFVPIYLVKKRGKIYRKSRCLWPRSLPERTYERPIEADLEVSQVRTGRNLIPVLLIKVQEGLPTSSRECFWPRAKAGRQIGGQGGPKPEYIVLTA